MLAMSHTLRVRICNKFGHTAPLSEIRWHSSQPCTISPSRATRAFILSRTHTYTHDHAPTRHRRSSSARAANPPTRIPHPRRARPRAAAGVSARPCRPAGCAPHRTATAHTVRRVSPTIAHARTLPPSEHTRTHVHTHARTHAQPHTLAHTHTRTHTSAASSQAPLTGVERGS